MQPFLGRPLYNTQKPTRTHRHNLTWCDLSSVATAPQSWTPLRPPHPAFPTSPRRPNSRSAAAPAPAGSRKRTTTPSLNDVGTTFLCMTRSRHWSFWRRRKCRGRRKNPQPMQPRWTRERRRPRLSRQRQPRCHTATSRQVIFRPVSSRCL